MYRQLPYRTGNTAISGSSRYLVPFIGGIATPVCALARNDRKNVQTPIYRTASGGGVGSVDNLGLYNLYEITIENGENL